MCYADVHPLSEVVQLCENFWFFYDCVDNESAIFHKPSVFPFVERNRGKYEKW